MADLEAPLVGVGHGDAITVDAVARLHDLVEKTSLACDAGVSLGCGRIRRCQSRRLGDVAEGRALLRQPVRSEDRLPTELARRRERHDVALVLVARPGSARRRRTTSPWPPTGLSAVAQAPVREGHPAAERAIMSLAAGTQPDAAAAVVLAVDAARPSRRRRHRRSRRGRAR